MDINKLIESGESETVEFKKSTGAWKEIVETVSGFANRRGGIILVGVDKKGVISGCDIGKGTKEFLVSKPTATRDLRELAKKGIVTLIGGGKRNIHYILIKPKMSQK